ncbi:mitochondrial FAD-linked sulfhydryl oxidase [Marchantia polymorpha subsp. ruderalis]|uniref:Sulfhydryl oxidase n=2 Tax=Marchantia polymorpha TaxID=3197 RepID=A0A176VMW0_MARPO|nr:hypothetical protein AXG93_2117s1060 [Marchantia polymorpha subsp. ruderalis]PTQ41063.1 hypothetical protein MARPO_0036s0053 [Marchantia polymorpha]BBM97760.1 hypothetical protein Mp_1g08090 [Marchantia polymorpha subsp. ruderalis]|eukprot:PTQ41063.1 hypothetical protein MARPO_0036s0053 [Marchantia polymorpha]
MDDITRTVVNLSNHMASSLSSSFRADAIACSSCRIDSGIMGALHNPALFFEKLFGHSGNREDRQLHPRLLARIRLPFAGPNASKHERMTVKSRRVVDWDAVETSGLQGTNSNSPVAEQMPSESVSTEWSPSNHSTLEESPLDSSESSEVNSAVSREDLGRATWTFLHTLAAQFPDQPTKQQQRDVKDLMGILSRIYPCKECADHFKDVLRANPVESKSGEALGQWMCRVHNVVNRSLGKAQFPCNRVDLRWGALNCNEGACDLHGRYYR